MKERTRTARLNFQRFFSSDRIWFICSKRENISPLHWIKCTARHISVVTRPHFQIPLNHKIFHYCQLLSPWPGSVCTGLLSSSSGSDKSPGPGSCSGRMMRTNWERRGETGDNSMLLASVSRGPGPRRWWDGGRVRLGAGARSSRHTRTTAWIYHPSQGPDPWLPLSDVILGSNSRYQEEEKSLLKIFFDDTATRKRNSYPVNFFFKAGTWLCRGCNKYKGVSSFLTISPGTDQSFFIHCQTYWKLHYTSQISSCLLSSALILLLINLKQF